MCGQRVCFQHHPPEGGWAPQSPVQVTGGAVVAEATSSRTSGPSSAAQSSRDHDRLKFRPGKLAKWATQCHHSAPRNACDQLRWLP